MRIILEEDPAWEEVEVTIRCKEVTPQVAGLVASLRRFDHRLTGEREGKTYLLEAGELFYIESVEKRGSGIASVPVTDTIKRAAPDGLVLDTPDRSALRAMQTPQAFRVELIRKAHEIARRDGFLGTDDAALLEHAGMPVYLCEGSRENLKLTTPTDLMLAGLILAARAEKELIG